MHYESAYVYDEAMHRVLERQVFRDHPARLWRRRVIQWGFPLLTVCFGASAALLQAGGDRSNAELLWIGCAIFGVYALLLPCIRGIRRRRAVRRRRPGALQHVEQTVTLSDRGVTSDLKEFGSSALAWISFCRATCSEKLLLIYMSRVDYIAFPRGARSDAEWAVLCDEVKAKMGERKC
ncbi:hypothetical protein [Terriglobus sp.]|uniref:hypothetical protein n=1 Tax=Terriglobus sp. TaxID=1889013 RepID=UPI003AFFBB0C